MSANVALNPLYRCAQPVRTGALARKLRLGIWPE